MDAPAALADADRTDAPQALPEPPPEPERDPRIDDEWRIRALSVAEAALVVGLHESTLRRYLRAERFPRAYRGRDDAWRIPVADLVSEGLLSRSADAGLPTVVAELETELERLQAENAEMRRRLAVAETLADERAGEIRELRLSLRMLLDTEPPGHGTVTRRRDPRPFVWSGEIALKDG